MASYNLDAPRCQHIKDSGMQCGSPALRGQAFCYHHQRIHYPRLRPGQKGYLIPALETPEAVTLAAIQIAQAAHDGTLSLNVARLMLHAVRFAAPYAGKHYAYAPEVATVLPPAMQSVCNIAVIPQPSQPNLPGAVVAAAAPPAISNNQSINTLDHPLPSSPDDPMNRCSDDQIRNSIFCPDPEAVRAYWTQHLPPEVANARGPDGDLLYEPPTWLPLTPEQLAYLRDHQPPDHAPGTPEEQENHERLSLHFTRYGLRPPQLEAVLENRRRLQATDDRWNNIFATIKKSPQKAVQMLNDALASASEPESTPADRA